jgi:DNA-binding MarR family transcriptional regulator
MGGKRVAKKAADIVESHRDRLKLEALENDITFHIMSIANLIARHTAHNTLNGSGLNPNEWRVIRFLALYELASAADIIATIGIDKTTVSRAISGLNTAKLIRLTPSPTDRRQTLLSLTRKGSQLHDRIYPIDQARDASFEEQLTSGEANALRPILVKLRRHAQASANDGDTRSTARHQ